MSTFASPAQNKQLTLDTFDTTFSAALDKNSLFAYIALADDQIVGYMVAQVNQVESITRENQTRILDLVAPSQEAFNEFITLSCEPARASGDSYLVYHTFESQTQEKSWCEKRGLKTELFRTFMAVSPGDQFESHPDYHLRRAQEHEMLFILRVVADHSPAYIPAHREVDKQDVQTRFVGSYSGLKSTDKKKVPLVLVCRSTEELMGYMILQPGHLYGDRGPVSMYLYDIAVGPRGHGLGLSRWMALGSKQLMEKMGGGILYGDVSPVNRLALSATLALGSRIDSRRWGLKL